MKIPAEITLITNQSERTELHVCGYAEIGDPFLLYCDLNGYSAKLSLSGERAEIRKSGNDGYTMILVKGEVTDFTIGGLTLKIRTNSLRFKATENKMTFAANYFFEPDSENSTDIIIKADYCRFGK